MSRAARANSSVTRRGGPELAHAGLWRPVSSVLRALAEGALVVLGPAEIVVEVVSVARASERAAARIPKPPILRGAPPAGGATLTFGGLPLSRGSSSLRSVLLAVI